MTSSAMSAPAVAIVKSGNDNLKRNPCYRSQCIGDKGFSEVELRVKRAFAISMV